MGMVSFVCILCARLHYLDPLVSSASIQLQFVRVDPREIAREGENGTAE